MAISDDKELQLQHTMERVLTLKSVNKSSVCEWFLNFDIKIRISLNHRNIVTITRPFIIEDISMLPIVFIVLMIVQVFCLVLAVQHYRKTRSNYDILPVIVIAGLVYDNAVIALGGFMEAGDTLRSLNAPRFIIHGLATPLLMIWGFGLARRLGFGWAQSRRNHAILCGVASLLIALGAYSDVLRLDLQIKVEQGITRYVNVGGIKGPPIASIVTIIFLLVIGVFIWRQRKAAGLAIGSTIMFFGAMAGAALLGVGNVAEVAMSAGVLSGQRTK
jgi:hypothetical protein